MRLFDAAKTSQELGSLRSCSEQHELVVMLSDSRRLSKVSVALSDQKRLLSESIQGRRLNHFIVFMSGGGTVANQCNKWKYIQFS